MLGKVLTQSKGFFPDGYKLIYTGTFPGFDSTKRIPLTVSVAISGTGPCGSVPSGTGFVKCLDGTQKSMIYAYGNDNSGGYGSGTLKTSFYATSTVDLMYLFNYDFEKMKLINFANGGTVLSWLEKIGGGGS